MKAKPLVLFAFVLFVIAAIVGFGFHTQEHLDVAVGLVAAGLASFMASLLVP